MPRERNEIVRASKIKEPEKIIVLAFEGNITEEAYFEALKSSAIFNDELIYLHLLTRPKTDTNSAPKHVFNKLKREAKDEYNFNKNDELWMIIDKDKWQNIDEIIKLCKAQKNMFVAVSNPCFEFWLLLHICKFADLSEDQKNKLLTNSKVSNNRRYIDKLLGEQLGDGYHKSKPRSERFMDKVKEAIHESKTIDNINEDHPTQLGSHVYKIVEKIIK